MAFEKPDIQTVKDTKTCCASCFECIPKGSKVWVIWLDKAYGRGKNFICPVCIHISNKRTEESLEMVEKEYIARAI